jgi:hypothetical protein
VETTQFIQGRVVRPEEVEALRRLIAAHPDWSRRRLSVAWCEQLNWRTVAGQLKDMSARLLMAKLAARQLVTLPARQRRGGRRTPRVLLELRQLELLAEAEAAPIEGAIATVLPLQVQVVEPGQPEADVFLRYLARHHYLGFGGEAGQNLRYLIRDAQGRDLACCLFGCAAWKVAARDQFIGWTHAQRQAGLGRIANNSRFLILPHVRVPHLASHLLGVLLRRLPADWQRKYRVQPVLVETFVERERFRGTCYRASNWHYLGQTRGRSRADRHQTLHVPVKDVYVYPLCRNFKDRLCA